MKTIEISDATKSLADYAGRVKQDPVLVTRKGKPVAVLSSAEGMDAESIALANNPKFVAIIERSRARHKTEGGLTNHEVRRRLGLARDESKRSKRR